MIRGIDGRGGAWFKRVLHGMHGFFHPVRMECLQCKQKATLEAEHLGLCRACYWSIPWIRTVLCKICGRYESCHDCSRRKAAHFVSSRSAVRYNAGMKELLARYKYRGDERLKTLIGEMLIHAYRLLDDSQRGMPSDAGGAWITFVPVSHERMQERGFNQAEQMARVLGERVRLPVVPLLRRIRHTDKQSFKSRSDRLGDLQHVFEMDPDAVKQLGSFQEPSAARILLVDDVYTTGSTMNQCAKVLRERFRAEVYGITWAR